MSGSLDTTPLLDTLGCTKLVIAPWTKITMNGTINRHSPQVAVIPILRSFLMRGTRRCKGYCISHPTLQIRSITFKIHGKRLRTKYRGGILYLDGDYWEIRQNGLVFVICKCHAELLSLINMHFKRTYGLRPFRGLLCSPQYYNSFSGGVSEFD